jgi:hypothetical protein
MVRMLQGHPEEVATRRRTCHCLPIMKTESLACVGGKFRGNTGTMGEPVSRNTSCTQNHGTMFGSDNHPCTISIAACSRVLSIL